VWPQRAHPGKIAVTSRRRPPIKEQMMANIPGAVTDPSRVKGEAIHFKSGDDSIPGYLARPAQPGSCPGIVVIHEAFGLVEHIRDLARRFANIGYNALAPDLYARAGGPKDPNDINTVMPVMFGLPDKQAVQDLEAAAAHLRGLSGATAKVGVLGRPAHVAVRLQQQQS
jgi:carboxymethylenebutenolidase